MFYVESQSLSRAKISERVLSICSQAHFYLLGNDRLTQKCLILEILFRRLSFWIQTVCALLFVFVIDASRVFNYLGSLLLCINFAMSCDHYEETLGWILPIFIVLVVIIHTIFHLTTLFIFKTLLTAFTGVILKTTLVLVLHCCLYNKKVDYIEMR